MSRTENENRNIIPFSKPNKKRGIIGKKIRHSKRKMKPMLAGKRNNYGKLSYSDGIDVPFSIKTKSMKTEIKNANRAVKKSERQLAKREIQQTINDEWKTNN